MPPVVGGPCVGGAESHRRDGDQIAAPGRSREGESPPLKGSGEGAPGNRASERYDVRAREGNDWYRLEYTCTLTTPPVGGVCGAPISKYAIEGAMLLGPRIGAGAVGAEIDATESDEELNVGVIPSLGVGEVCGAPISK